MSKYEQDFLPKFLDVEAEARESDIDYETYVRHKQAMAKRWFGYYKKCKDSNKKFTIIDQFNKIASMCVRQRG